MPYPNESTVLLVAHNSMNKALISVITGKSAQNINCLENQHNTATNIFELAKNGNHQLHVFNCVKHLERIVYKSPDN